MKRISMILAVTSLILFMFIARQPASAQDHSSSATGSSVQPNAVAQGTRFLIGLDNMLGTKDSKAGEQFTGHTLEPLIAADGTGLPAGAEIRGHIDKIEAAGKTGRARMWLAFDDIKTPDGWMPLVAMVDDVPG